MRATTRLRAAAPAVALVVFTSLLASAPAYGGPDPAATGTYAVDQIDYDGGYTTLSDPNGVTIVEQLKGVIHLPDSSGGPWPLIVILHGRHATCRYADRVESFGNPCPEAPPVTSDVTSYRGYDYLASNLASHGYVVASISANAINSNDLALLLSDSGMLWRAQLVARTLDLLSEWNKAPGPREVERRLIGTMDFDRIGLMGHSRGGEGVARFVAYNKDRTDGPTYKGLRAVFALAPTDFYDQRVPGVHFGTLLPLCDGDVYNLQGAWMFDRARFLKPENFARVQFTVNGANHNFFNTVWTFDDGESGGDDTGNNPACMPSRPESVRLDAREQRQVGLMLMSAFLRRYVGGENQFDQLMTGEAALPSSACPKKKRSCPNLVGTSYVGPSSSRRMLLLPDQTNDGYKAAGFENTAVCQPGTNGVGCPTAPNRSTARQLALEWDSAATLRVPLTHRDISAFEAFTFRTAVNFSRPLNRPGKPQNLSVTIIDAGGHSRPVAAANYSNALRPPAGPEHQQITLNGVRIPLDAFRGADLDAAVAIELRFGRLTRTGSIQLAELALQEVR